MKRYVVASAARNDLLDIQAYLTEHAGENSARRVVSQLIATFNLLALYPRIAQSRPYLGQALRFLPNQQYLIVYRASVDNPKRVMHSVEIVRVLHQARNARHILRGHAA